MKDIEIPKKRFAVEIRRNIAYGPHGERNLLDAYLPRNASRSRPAVIYIHGGGWCHGSKDGFIWHGKDLARRGFAAFMINYRFWPDACYPAAVEDAQLAVRWIRAHAGDFGINPRKIGGMGCSAGGHLGSLLALCGFRFGKNSTLGKYSSRLQCMVDVFGPVDFPAMMESASKPIVEGFIGKSFSTAKSTYLKASPVSYVSKGAPPFLIVHGTEDIGISRGQVPISISASFYTKLRMAGAEACFMTIAGAGHGFMGDHRNPAAKQTWNAALKFFNNNLFSRE
ncbi:MAG TPA: hypothetical protein DCZ94_03855 [Lentisphaeria bacterium]|nr:MAG: hypothetical protein A2X48_05075 [Lentisphaerae bacterium GWF2_49_21]HBC86069.1 hypothetical protein [Lentisphaeria bacterium]